MTQREHPPYLVVGHLNKAHGTKGEVFVWPLTDRPGSHFAPGVVLFPADKEGERPADDRLPLEVESVRPYRKGFLAKFVGHQDRNAAEALRDTYVLRPFEDIDELEDGEVFYHELLGAEVVTKDGDAVGHVKEVYALKPTDLLEVARESDTIVIPVVEGVVTFERETGRVVVDPPPGLLEL
ncbi:MAG: ribosome maturation factor RimM [Longimicrobiales bacterium]